MGKVVGYVRVSTTKQGQSGLGIEAQIEEINAYASQHGREVVSIYQEIESGKVSDRPALAKALSHAKRIKAALVVAKLDRLARSVAFTSAVMDSGVDFVACDNPHATRLTLHILAAVAEHEAAATSARTKASLAAAKARGTKLGCPIAHEPSAIARKAYSIKARARARNIYAIVRDIESAGVASLGGIARALEARGIKTPCGTDSWQAVQVSRIKATAG